MVCKMASNSLVHWSVRDAIIWIVDRCEKRLSDHTFFLPSLTAWQLYSTMEGEGKEFAEAANLLIKKLQAGRISAKRIRSNGSGVEIEPGWWNEKSLRDLESNDPSIMLSAEAVKTEFPGSPQIRKSHDEVVEWCRAWIAAGNGTGMDKAWPAFNADPAHRGLSRDDVFRPAWKEAKWQ